MTTDIKRILGNIQNIVTNFPDNEETLELTDIIEEPKSSNPPPLNSNQVNKNINITSELKKSVVSSEKSPNSKTIDEIVIDILEPELKEWFNQNIERIVKSKVDEKIKEIISKI